MTKPRSFATSGGGARDARRNDWRPVPIAGRCRNGAGTFLDGPRGARRRSACPARSASAACVERSTWPDGRAHGGGACPQIVLPGGSSSRPAITGGVLRARGDSSAGPSDYQMKVNTECDRARRDRSSRIGEVGGGRREAVVVARKNGIRRDFSSSPPRDGGRRRRWTPATLRANLARRQPCSRCHSAAQIFASTRLPLTAGGRSIAELCRCEENDAQVRRSFAPRSDDEVLARRSPRARVRGSGWPKPRATRGGTSLTAVARRRDPREMLARHVRAGLLLEDAGRSATRARSFALGRRATPRPSRSWRGTRASSPLDRRAGDVAAGEPGTVILTARDGEYGTLVKRDLIRERRRT